MSKTLETTAIAAALTLLATSGAAIASPQPAVEAVTSHISLDQYGRPAVKGTDISGQISQVAQKTRALKKISGVNCHTCHMPTA